MKLFSFGSLTVPGLIFAFTLLSYGETRGIQGEISRSVFYNNVADTYIEALFTDHAFYEAPDESFNDPKLSSPTNQGGSFSFGQRYRGYLTAPVTGEYRFWVTGDDDQGLWVSSSDSKFDKREVARSRNWTIPGRFNQYKEQESRPIFLVEGERYYLEALQKEWGGGDHLGVMWSYASGPGLTNWVLESGVSATQSSIDLRGTPDRAIDNNIAGAAREGSVSITKSEPWARWEVDLGEPRLIDRIELFNRDKDNPVVTAQLGNYEIKILDSSGASIASRNFHTSGGYTRGMEFWEPGAKIGQRVRITQLGGSSRYLSLAEVRVLGRASIDETYLPQQILSGSVIETYAGSDLDTDDDELLDLWELSHGFDPTTLEQGDFSPAADPDGDGIFNAFESRKGTDPFVGNSLQGALTLEYWNNTYGNNVSDFFNTARFFQGADNKVVISPLSAVRLDNIQPETSYRMRGSFIAPTTGAYHFWISAKDGAEFWLSDDETKFRKRRLAAMGFEFGTAHGFGSEEGDIWDYYGSQMSEAVELEAGQSYFFEILGQRFGSWGANTALAWAPPEGERSLFPISLVSSFGGDPSDKDDDYLPDTWEVSYGLDAADSGLVDPLAEGEQGDFDDDGLTNHQEFLLGTDPSSADSDNDGLPDHLETQVYRTDPLVSDAPSEIIQSQIDLTTYNSTSGTWLLTDEGLVPTFFRGSVSFDFNIPSDGHWLVKVSVKLLGLSRSRTIIPVYLHINDRQLENRNLSFGADQLSAISVVTPFLTAGSHTIKLDIDNLIASQAVAIQRVELIKPGGLDADANGVPDWIDLLLREQNSLKVTSQFSRVSPAFLEGAARSSVTVNTKIPSRGVHQNHWFTSIPLDAENPTPVQISYADGLFESEDLVWDSTNIMDGETLRVRQNDSLLLSAMPPTGPTGDPVTVSLPGQTNHCLSPLAIATQSSTPYSRAPASNAIDGETFGPADHESTRTGNEPDSWWQVDLGAERSIKRIVIWNKKPTHWALSNFRVNLLDDAGILVLSKDFYTAEQWGVHVKEKEVWDLGAQYSARTVRLERIAPAWGTNVIELAEIQVFGSSVIEFADDSVVMPFEFKQPGTHVITASHPNGDIGQLTVEVKKGASDISSFDLLAGSRDWVSFSVDTTDADLTFDGSDLIQIADTPQFGRDPYGIINRFRLPAYARQRGGYNILLRTEPDGPVLDLQPVNVVGFVRTGQGGGYTTTGSAAFEGMLEITTPLVVTDLPLGGYVEVDSIRSGLIFLDGSSKLTLTASDFVDGIYQLSFLFPRSFIGGFCHRVTIFDSSGSPITRQ